MKSRLTFATRCVLAMLATMAVLMLVEPTNALAQVTIVHVRVTINQPATATLPARTSIYCDTGQCAGPNGNPIWDAAHGFTVGGVSLDPGETLVLTQTGVNGGAGGGNFDSSDAVHSDGTLRDCEAANPCTVTIEVDTGGGFLTVYSGSGELNNFNRGSTDPQETSQYNTVFTAAGSFTLGIGYADNVHFADCGGPCFPNPFNGTLQTTRATVFVGQGADGGSVYPWCDNGTPGIPGNDNCFDAGSILITGLSAEGRMTGGGSVFTADGTRVTHGFELHCNIADLPNNLEINWDGGNNFHLGELTSVICFNDPAITPNPPKAGFDTLVATGTGTLNGEAATIRFRLSDAGEPGTKDTAAYEITQNAVVVLSVGPANLDKGNQQAHKN